MGTATPISLPCIVPCLALPISALRWFLFLQETLPYCVNVRISFWLFLYP